MTDMEQIEQQRHEAECREWLARIRAKNPRNVAEGRKLLNRLIADVAQRRGKEAAERLRAGIEAVRRAEKGAT